MGMIDANLVFAEAQAVTSTGDTASTNSYDSGGTTLGDSGQTGEHIWVQALCSTVAASGGGATLQPVLQDSANNSSLADVVAGPVIGVASLTTGAQLWAVQPPPGMRRYWRIVWRVAVAALTSGNFDAFITESLQRNVAQASGYTVS